MLRLAAHLLIPWALIRSCRSHFAKYVCNVAAGLVVQSANISGEFLVTPTKNKGVGGIDTSKPWYRVGAAINGCYVARRMEIIDRKDHMNEK